MTKIRSLFNSEENKMLEEIGVVLVDDKDYSDDELDDIYDIITAYYQVSCFDKFSKPLPSARKWESIFDWFYDNCLKD